MTEGTIESKVFNQIMTEVSNLYENPLEVNEIVSSSYICIGSISEPAVSFTFRADGTNFIVISASVARGYSKAVIIAAALSLLNLGLHISECVVPGICYSGDSFAFIALYMIEDRWPIMVNLSGYLSVTGIHAKRVAEWFIRVFDFGISTAQKYKMMKKQRKLLKKNFGNFKFGELFLKPLEILDNSRSQDDDTSIEGSQLSSSDISLPPPQKKRKAESQGLYAFCLLILTHYWFLFVI